MIEVVDIRCCRLGTANLDSTADFATNLIGPGEVGRSNGQVYLRGDAAATRVALWALSTSPTQPEIPKFSNGRATES